MLFEMSDEIIYFDKTIKNVMFYLKLIGLNFENNIDHRRRWFYIYNFFHLNVDVGCEIVWLILHAATTGIEFIEVTYIIPCLSLCFLGNAKALCFLFNMENVRELFLKLKELFKVNEIKHPEKSTVWKELRKIGVMTKVLLYFNVSGAIGFALIPWVIFASKYYSTGEIKLSLPFIVSYPFDYTDIRFYPFAYVHQLWTGTFLCKNKFIKTFSALIIVTKYHKL